MRAVVATDAGDVPSLIEDGKTGFVVLEGTRHSADLVVTLMTMTRAGELGEAGRAQAERQFRLDRLVSKTLAAYWAVGWQEA